MSETQQFDPNGTGIYEAKFKLTGMVKTFPRVVSAFLPGEIKEFRAFQVNLLQTVILKDGQLQGKGVFGELHDSLRKIFADGAYTDVNGVIREFSDPRGPWWLEITQIDWAPIAFKGPLRSTESTEANTEATVLERA